MGKVIAIYSLKPESPETSLKEIEEELKKIENFKTFEEKPFMFGMMHILATFILPDKVENTGVEELEQKLQNIKGVSSVSQEAFTLA